MSGEILQALTQLFAIVARQDGIISEDEREYVANLFQYELDPGAAEKYINLFEKLSGYIPDQKSSPKDLSDAASVRDTIQILAICKKCVYNKLQLRFEFTSSSSPSFGNMLSM